MITIKMNMRIIIIYLLYSIHATAFDWQIYVTKYTELFAIRINSWDKALKHYLYFGREEGRETNLQTVPTSNFDWRYYVHTNNLHINNEQAALKHYEQEGKPKNLPFCKSLRFVILLHLYNLDLMDDFIEKINYFIQKNPQNSYHIKINIPIDRNIDNFFNKPENTNKLPSITPSDACYTTFQENILAPANYASHLINPNNYIRYYRLHEYLSRAFDKIPLQVIFSRNIGRDIGGFFLLLDQLIKQNIEHDFIIKLHTKTDVMWRNLLTSFLNICVNPILSEKECIYSNRIAWYFDRMNDGI